MKNRPMLVMLMVMVLLFAMILSFSPAPMTGHLFLKEVCIHNNGFLTDEDGGSYDYVVLYNPTDQEISLKGYALSDQRKLIRLHEFTEGTVPAHGETLLWISNGQTGFELSDREVLYLSNPQEAVIDKCGLPVMGEGTVYLRSMETGAWSIATPTRSGIVANPKQAASSDAPTAPRLSVPGGLYDEPVTVTLSAEAGCTIHYTLDATAPDASAPVYSEALLLSDRSGEENLYASISGISLTDDYVPQYPVAKGTVLRAVSITEDGTVSTETSAEYFIGFSQKAGYNTLPILSLVTNPDNLFSASRGIYTIGKLWTSERKLGMYSDIRAVPVNYSQSGKDWRRPGTATLFLPGGSCIGSESVRLGIHDNYSAANNQKSLNLFSTDGALFDSSLFGTPNHSLFLSSGGMTDYLSTKLRDVLVQGMMADRNVYTLRSMPVQVFLNGEYWGLYHLTQRIERSLIANAYALEKDDILLLKNGSSVGGKDKEDRAVYDAMLREALESDLSQPEAYASLCGQMDMQSYIDYIVAQTYIVNMDWQNSSLALWRTRSSDGTGYNDGRWRWILFDLDNSSACKGCLGADYDNLVMGTWAKPLLEDPLFSALIQNPDFRRQFVLSFMDMVNETFAFEHVNALLTEYEAQLALPMAETLKRFSDANATEADFHREVEVLRSFYRERGKYITKYLQNDLSLGYLYTLTVEAQDCEVSLNTLSLGTFPWQGEYFSDYAVTLSCKGALGWLVNGSYTEGETLNLQLTQDSTVCPVFSQDLSEGRDGNA